MVKIATNRHVDRAELEGFVSPRHRGVFLTVRGNGLPQASLVTMGLHDGKIMIASYPGRSKVANLRRKPQASMVVMSETFNDEWVQVNGTAKVVDVPEALDGLVEYFRAISGEHSDWDDYRDAMVKQGKCLITFSIDDWGPIATGGFPPRFAD